MTSNAATARFLRAAWDLISDPDRWHQDSIARTANGDDTYSMAPDAVAWCAAGALNRTAAADKVNEANYERAFVDALTALSSAAQQLRPDPGAIIRNPNPTIAANASVARFNDAASHDDVALMFKHAIADVEAGQVGP